MQWKAATPRLQEIRDRELRQLDDQLATKPTLPRPESPEQNGLVQFQRWMMRLALAEYSKSRG